MEDIAKYFCWAGRVCCCCSWGWPVSVIPVAAWAAVHLAGGAALGLGRRRFGVGWPTLVVLGGCWPCSPGQRPVLNLVIGRRRRRLETHLGLNRRRHSGQSAPQRAVPVSRHDLGSVDRRIGGGVSRGVAGEATRRGENSRATYLTSMALSALAGMTIAAMMKSRFSFGKHSCETMRAVTFFVNGLVNDYGCWLVGCKPDDYPDRGGRRRGALSGAGAATACGGRRPGQRRRRGAGRDAGRRRSGGAAQARQETRRTWNWRWSGRCATSAGECCS